MLKKFDPRKVGHVLSLDGETDGFYGAVWAIGAVVLDKITGVEVARFAGQVDPSDVKSDWVQEHVVPYVDLPLYADRRSLRDAFWAFWLEWREDANVVADCGDKVEAGLFRACVEDDLASRERLAPWPIYDLAVLLLMHGYNPQEYTVGEPASRIMLAGLEGQGLNLHNPVDDAMASGLCWVKFSQIHTS